MGHNNWPAGAPEPYLPCGSARWPALFDGMGRLATQWAGRFARWRRYRRTVRALSRVDARTLKDIGLPGGPGAIHAAAMQTTRWAAANDNHHDRAA